MTDHTTTPLAHSPAPWRVVNSNEICTDDEHESLIAEVFDETDLWRGNARLIAAAPDLLECAKMLYVVTAEGEIKKAERVEMFDAAEAAIAKAEGRG
jgi:hypothetical protein